MIKRFKWCGLVNSGLVDSQGRVRDGAFGLAGVVLALLLVAPAVGGPQDQDRVTGRGDERLSQAEGRNIHTLLSNHMLLLRHVVHEYQDEYGTGVMTLTWVKDPDRYPWLVEVLRDHVEQMESRMERGARIYQREPVFRGIFDMADVIRLDYEDIPGGIMVIETSPDPIAAALIQLHAEKVDLFIAEGQAALLPPTARGGRVPRP